MKHIKHWLATMAVLLCSTSASSHDFEVNGIYYEIIPSTNTVAVTFKGEYDYSYDDEYSGDIVIPSAVTYNGNLYDVTSIWTYAFSYCSAVTSVVIPESVTSIQHYAFDNCESLVEVIFNDSNTPIELGYSSNSSTTGCGLFSRCQNIERVYIGRDLSYPINSSYGRSPFHYRTKLKSVTFGDCVTTINNYLFENCSKLSSVTIGRNVSKIGEYSFNSCGIYKVVNYSNLPIAAGLSDYGKVASSAKIVLNGDELFTVDDFQFQTKEDKHFFVNYIGLDKEINLPENYKGMSYNVEDCAFCGNSNIISVVIPENINELGEYAFFNCSNLTEITIPSSMTRFGYAAFGGCDIDKIHIKNIESWLAIDVNDNSYPNTSRPNNWEVNLYLDKTLLTDLEIPSTIESIPDYSFRGCSCIVSISIPESTIRIGDYSFSGTTLSSIICKAPTPPTIYSSTFHNIDKSIPVYVPISSVSAYQSAYYWSEFTNIQAIPGDYYTIDYVVDGNTIYTDNAETNDIVTPLAMEEREGYTFSGWTLSAPINIKENADAMLYTNAPCTDERWGDQFVGWHVLFDDDAETFFHSEYSSGVDSEDGLDHYLRVDLGEGNELSSFTFTYTVRGEIPNYGNYSPKKMVVEGANSADGEYTEIASLTDLPSIAAEVYNSPILSNGNKYRYIRFRVTETYQNSKIEGHPYFFMAEFGMEEYKAINEPFVMPAKNIVLNGEYNINSYLLTFKNGDEVVASYEQPYGNVIVAPELPESENQVVEWIGLPETMPAQNVEVVGRYTLSLVDGGVDSFKQSVNERSTSITYTRNFTNTAWQALYVPFEIPVTEEFLTDFEVADLNDVRQYDRDDDGVKDETVIEAFKVKSGVLEANYPYLIRAREAGEKTITVTDATLYATEENSIDCSSVREKFTFMGTYSQLSSEELPQGEGYYALSGGVWQPVAEGASLGAFRFYLKVDSRNSLNAAQGNAIRMRIIGEDGEEDDATRIDTPEFKDQKSELIFDLQGRRVKNPTKGVYIVNGVKRVF